METTKQKPAPWIKAGSKSDAIRKLLEVRPRLKSQEIAMRANASPQLVTFVKKKLKTQRPARVGRKGAAHISAGGANGDAVMMAETRIERGGETLVTFRATPEIMERMALSEIVAKIKRAAGYA